jgi:protease I
MRTNAMNPHLTAAPVVVGAPLEEATLAVVAVHGRDQSPEWILDNLIRPLELPGAAYILPAADGGSWYPGRFHDPVEDNEPWLGRALEACAAAVRTAEDARVPVERVALAGFSQGACLIAEMVAREPRPYAAVAVLTGGVMGTDDELTDPAGSLAGVRVLLSGHVVDDWVPAERVRVTAELFRRAGADVELLSLKEGEFQGFEHLDKGKTFKADRAVADADPDDYDALVLPGGVANPDFLRADEDAVAFVRRMAQSGKPIGAICHGPWTLVEAGVVDGRTVTSWPSLKTDIRNAGGNWVDEEVHVDRGLVTSRKPDDLPAFCAKLIEEIAEGVHARGREAASAR